MARTATTDRLAASYAEDSLPLSPEVQAIVDAQEIDMGISGLVYLPNNEARVRSSKSELPAIKPCARTSVDCIFL